MTTSNKSILVGAIIVSIVLCLVSQAILFIDVDSQSLHYWILVLFQNLVNLEFQRNIGGNLDFLKCVICIIDA